jgi:hypothetical protein
MQRVLPLRHRFLAIILAIVVMVGAVALGRRAQQPTYTLRVTLGLLDKEPAEWNGQVHVDGGELVTLAGWRFEYPDAVQDKVGWKCRTRNHIAPGVRNPMLPAHKKPEAARQTIWPNGVTLTVQGDAPAVTLSLSRGKVQFNVKDMSLGEPRLFLDAQVRVERLPTTQLVRPPAQPITDNIYQDDYPAFWIRYKTGKHYVAWVSYQGGKDRVLLAERDGPEGEWSEPTEIAGPGDHFRVALAGTHDDTVWAVWSSQRQGNWDLYARPYRHGKLGAEVRLTDAPGPDIWQRMTTDGKGRAWLVWQGFRDGQADIFARCADADGWHEPIRVSTSKANDWDPCICADPKEDRVWVGWDTYETGSYGVRVRSLSDGPTPTLGEVLVPEVSPRFGAHVSLACDRGGRLWAAWDESGPDWGKDTGYLYQSTAATGLYATRNLRIKFLVDGRWLEPDPDFASCLPEDAREFNELPQLQEASDGRMWVAFRHRTSRVPRADGWAAQGRWDGFATTLGEKGWLPPIELPHSAGRNDMRFTSQRDRDGNVYFAYASDNRFWMPPGMAPRDHSVAVAKLGGLGPRLEPGISKRLERTPDAAPVHPRERAQVARIRNYQVEAGGKKYRIYRGDLHRHTDMSVDGVGDGSIMDLHRYALDAAALDFVLIADHNMGSGIEYCWWRTQKANDLYTVPGVFISMYGYERSVPYPNGHRNVIWSERGHRALKLPQAAIPKQMADDTARLYAYLRETDGICTLHTSATGQGTDWREHDDKLEPFVELFQGFHGSYEAPGAPRIVDADSDIIHTSFKPDGYVSNALEKGLRLGFQASSDHVSTHVSYACVLAEEFSRKGLVDAMRKRHTYAATDNIVLDVRMGTHGIMGDEVRTPQPRLSVLVLGTGPLDRVDVIRNGAVVHTERAGQNPEEARFQWEDKSPLKSAKPSYYYVRVLQKDGQMAWASPIWVTAGE